MPCQVSWQAVAINSQASVHGLGAEAATAGGALVGTTSAAHASTSHEAPAAARIIAAKIPSFVMRAPLAQTWTIELVKVRHNRRHYAPWQKNSETVAAASQ